MAVGFIEPAKQIMKVGNKNDWIYGGIIMKKARLLGKIYAYEQVVSLIEPIPNTC